MTTFDGVDRRPSGRLALAPARAGRRDRNLHITRGASRAAAEALERRVLLSTTIAAPTHLVASINGGVSVFLSWQEVPDANNYVVEQAPAGTGNFVVVDQPWSPDALESGLEPTRGYDFRVRAVAPDGTESAPSAIATVQVPIQPPASFQASAVSSSRIDLTWDMGDDPPASVEIDRSTENLSFARVAVLPAGTLRYSDTGLTEGTPYCYMLRAIQGRATSDWSNPFGAVTPPTAPAQLTARTGNTDNEIDLSWRNSPNTQTVQIFRSDGAGTDFNLETDYVVAPENTYRETGLDPGHTYQYYVVAGVDPPPNTCPGFGFATSVPSNTVTVTTPAAGVTDLGAAPVSSSEIDLTWTGTIRGATGIEVDVSSDGQTYRRVATLPASARSFHHVGLTPNTHHWYEVRALRASGPTAFTPVDAYTLAPAPSNLRARLDGPEHVQLTWRSNDPPDTTFEIERGFAGSKDFTPVGYTAGTSYRVMFDAPGERVWYQVVALNDNNDGSAPTNAVSLTVPSPWPGTPDQNFGQGGVAGELFVGGSANSVAIAPDGKIVVAGNPGALDSTLVLARYNADGSLDPSFGTDGQLVTPWSVADQTHELLVQPDGKVVVTGSDIDGNLVVARYLDNGAPDPSFGRGGVAVVNLMAWNEESAVALQPDGKIVAAGVVSEASLAVARLTPNGAPDATFGTGGTVITPIEPYIYGPVAVHVLRNGSIIAGAELSLVRYTANGRLDTSFGTGGIVPSQPYDVVEQPDGKLLVRSAGYVVNRLLPDGSPDLSFGDSGTTLVDGNGVSIVLESDGTIVVPTDNSLVPLQALTPAGQPDGAFQSGEPAGVPFQGTFAASQADGRIVLVGGVVDPSSNESRGFAALRYLPNGSLDSSFGYFGLSDIPDGLSGGVRAVALQRDGKIVAAGNEVNPDPTLPNAAGLVRYNTDGTLDRSFGRNGRIYLRIGHEADLDTIAVQPGGDIVAGGSGEVRGVKVFVVARFLPDGFPDPSFGTNGVATRTFGGSTTQECTSLSVQGNGDIVAVGSTDRQIVVERLLPSGALDPRFGMGGIVMLDPAGGPASAGAMALQSDGRIVIGGTLNYNFGVIRLTTGGALDPTFGSGGVVRTIIAGGSTAAALLLDRQGRIVLGGTSDDAGLPILARYLPGGRLDTTFGAGGITRPTSLSPDPSGQTVTNLALDSQGRLIARLASLSLSPLGPRMTPPSSPIVFRLTDRGVDPDFGPGGATLAGPDFLAFGGLATDSSGRILAGALGVWRLNDQP